MERKDLVSTSAENSKWFSNVFFEDNKKLLRNRRIYYLHYHEAAKLI